MILFKYDKTIEETIFHKYVEGKKSPEVVKMIADEIRNIQILPEQDGLAKQLISHIQKTWEKTEQNFYQHLGSFYEMEISTPDLTCFLTRLDIFPYDFSEGTTEKWFTAPFFKNPVERQRVIMHELCHYFQPVELDRDIKEAIPVILNDHKSFRMFSFDKGHDSEKEQEWRKIIWDIYQKGGKFKDVLSLIKEKQG